jgi:hypothetical protein
MVKLKVKQVVFETLILKIFSYIGLKFVHAIIKVYHQGILSRGTKD